MRLIPATLLAILFAAPAFAAMEPSPATYPAGAIGCINYREAKNYTFNKAKAPQFASDQLARAACVENKTDLPAIKKAVVGDYTQLQLLSGHRVWLLNTYLSAN